MKDTQDIAIALLTVTAVILAALLISSHSGSNIVYAGNTPVKQGDYIMATNQSASSTDMLIITDIAARRMNIYQTNINNWSIELLDTVNLERAFGQ